MSDKIKETIQADEIEAKDITRRKFMKAAAGTVVAAGAVSATGCLASCDADYTHYRDYDSFNTTIVYADSC